MPTNNNDNHDTNKQFTDYHAELYAAQEEWSDLNHVIDNSVHNLNADMVALQRMKKRRLILKDKINRLKSLLYPDTIA